MNWDYAQTLQILACRHAKRFPALQTLQTGGTCTLVYLYLAKSVCGFMDIERIHLSVYLFGVISSICVGDGLCRRVLETGMGWEKSRRNNLQHNVIPSYAVYQVNCYASTYKHIYIHISSCIRGTVC